jgi:integration host factor subunit beta
MTKAELVEEVARAAELNKRDAEVIVETVFDAIISTLHKGEKVELRGFGSFRTRERGPRRGRNPKTGEPVDVPAKRVPYFKPGKELKEYFTDEEAGEASETEQHPAGEASGQEDHHEAPVEVSTEVSTEGSTNGDGHVAETTAGESTSPEGSTGSASENSGTLGSAG